MPRALALTVAALLLVFFPAAGAQAPVQVAPHEEAPAVPPLTAVEQGQLSLWESRIEAGQLKVALAQAQLELARRDAEAFLTSLQRPGYTIQRGPTGEWVRVAEPTR